MKTEDTRVHSICKNCERDIERIMGGSWVHRDYQLCTMPAPQDISIPADLPTMPNLATRFSPNAPEQRVIRTYNRMSSECWADPETKKHVMFGLRLALALLAREG